MEKFDKDPFEVQLSPEMEEMAAGLRLVGDDDALQLVPMEEMVPPHDAGQTVEASGNTPADQGKGEETVAQKEGPDLEAQSDKEVVKNLETLRAELNGFDLKKCESIKEFEASLQQFSNFFYTLVQGQLESLRDNNLPKSGFLAHIDEVRALAQEGLEKFYVHVKTQGETLRKKFINNDEAAAIIGRVANAFMNTALAGRYLNGKENPLVEICSDPDKVVLEKLSELNYVGAGKRIADGEFSEFFAAPDSRY